MMKKMGKEMGEDFSGEDFDEAMEEMESGGDLDDSGEGSGGDDLKDLTNNEFRCPLASVRPEQDFVCPPPHGPTTVAALNPQIDAPIRA
jgi:hypothetical protein